MSDIKKDIAKDFRELTSRNAKIKELSKKLEAGKASYLDADSLALELATALGKALHNNLGNDQLVGEDYKALMREVLPAGLHDIYEDVADYAVTIQRGIYLRQNIGLRVAPPDFNTVEVDEITGKATMVDSYKEIPGGLTNDIQHMAQNVATDTMDKNARLAREVGYEPVVTRVYDRIGVHTQNGGKYKKDCQWCLSRCGTDVPYGEAKSRDMFRRHPGCKCRIEYTVNGKTQVQTDWQGNQWSEREEWHRGKKRNTEIATSTINSSDYSRRLSSIDSDRKVTETIILEGRKMLRHRSGTLYEDLSFIDIRTGDFITRTDYDCERKVIPSKRQLRMLAKAPEHSIVAVHNHPESSVPSPDDIYAANERKYAYGVVLGHNGTIIKYSIRPKDFNEAAYISVFAKLEIMGYNEEGLKMYVDEAREIGLDIEIL